MDYSRLAQDGAMIIAFFLIVKWILEQFKSELEGNRRERTEYLTKLDKISDKMEQHDLRAKENHAGSQSEHKEMIITLGRINGYKKD